MFPVFAIGGHVFAAGIANLAGNDNDLIVSVAFGNIARRNYRNWCHTPSHPLTPPRHTLPPPRKLPPAYLPSPARRQRARRCSRGLRRWWGWAAPFLQLPQTPHQRRIIRRLAGFVNLLRRLRVRHTRPRPVLWTGARNHDETGPGACPSTNVTLSPCAMAETTSEITASMSVSTRCNLMPNVSFPPSSR